MNNIFKEIEYKYFDADTNILRQRLREVGAVMVRPKIIMRLIRFTHPTEKKDSYIRIRDEGNRITMTSKTNLDDRFVTEYEIVISNFNYGVKILESLGCKKIYYLEKFRETWNFMNTEIVIDSSPGTPEYVEIEAESEDQIIRVQQMLGLGLGLGLGLNKLLGNGPEFRKYDLYDTEYGIRSDKIIKGDIKFDNAMQKLWPNLQSNKEKFEKILRQQLEEISKKKSCL